MKYICLKRIVGNVILILSREHTAGLIWKAGVNTDTFKAHSVRSASVTAAANAGITTSVFQKFYYKPTGDTVLAQQFCQQLPKLLSPLELQNHIDVWNWAFWSIITEWLRPWSGCQLFWIIWRMRSWACQRPILSKYSFPTPFSFIISTNQRFDHNIMYMNKQTHRPTTHYQKSRGVKRMQRFLLRGCTFWSWRHTDHSIHQYHLHSSNWVL